MKITINNDTWKVCFISGNKKKMNPIPGETVNLGLTEYIDLEISIRKGMKESVTRQTVIHELCHAFIRSYGATVDCEEGVCDFFGAFADQILCLADQIMRRWKEDADNR